LTETWFVLKRALLLGWREIAMTAHPFFKMLAPLRSWPMLPPLIGVWMRVAAHRVLSKHRSGSTPKRSGESRHGSRKKSRDERRLKHVPNFGSNWHRNQHYREICDSLEHLEVSVASSRAFRIYSTL
jgi:hypothetical protein